MPLSRVSLENSCIFLFNADNHELTKLDSVTNFANAVANYMVNVFPLTTTSVSTITAIIIPELFNMNLTDQDGDIHLKQALVLASQLVGAGMRPAYNYVAPLLSGLDFTSLYSAGISGASFSTQANSFSTIVDTWMRTGQAISTSGGGTINWS